MEGGRRHPTRSDRGGVYSAPERNFLGRKRPRERRYRRDRNLGDHLKRVPRTVRQGATAGGDAAHATSIMSRMASAASVPAIGRTASVVSAHARRCLVVRIAFSPLTSRSPPRYKQA